MPAILDRIPDGSRILVIRMRSLGDCVLTTPALALLRAHRPDVRIGVVVEDRFRGVFDGNPDIDELLPPEMGVVADWKPQLALNYHGGTRSIWMTAASRADVRAGFAHHVHSWVYTEKIPRAQKIFGEERPVHTAEHLASAMFWLGVPQQEIPRAKLFAEPLSDAPDGPYAVVHPFAALPEKAWPLERFLEVARRLREHTGFAPVFLAGPDDDIRETEDFPVYRSTQVTLAKSLISRAQLFVGNDSGPAHIAAAFGVPVVVLFGPTDPTTWYPWRTESQVLRGQPMSEIAVSKVIAATDALKVRA